MTFTPQGVCSQKIDFDIVDGKVTHVQFLGGCNGNTQGVSALVEGMDAKKVISLLKGINCNGRGTSCPDQLASALQEAIS